MELCNIGSVAPQLSSQLIKIALACADHLLKAIDGRQRLAGLYLQGGTEWLVGKSTRLLLVHVGVGNIYGFMACGRMAGPV